MQPRQMRETCIPVDPNRAYSMVFSFIKLTTTCLARHQLNGCGACLRCHHGVNVLCIIMAVLAVVHFVDLVIDGGVGYLHEGDILVDTTRLDMAGVARQHSAEPWPAAAFK